MEGESAIENANDSLQRRTANYKPNIWDYDHIQSLTATNYHEEKYKREAEMMKEDVCGVLVAIKDPVRKLELIDEINKLALSYFFEDEISECLKEIACLKTVDHNNLYSAALHFRILRQHGHHVSQDGILQLLDDKEEIPEDEKASNEILEASHLSLEDECLMDRAKAFAAKNLMNSNDHNQEKTYSTKSCPLNWSVTWYNARKHIMHADNKSTLHRLAGLSFNMVQAQHQKELKEIVRWWRNLGLSEVLTFTRDRAVESFLLAVGVAYEPQYGSLRKWLTKAITLIVILDDVYDIYGSKNELEQFTIAVERWDPSEIEQLPEAIKRCFWALYNTANDIDNEIQQEKGWSSVLPHLRKVWTDFCKALFVEAKWYHESHSPSLKEYLDNAWVTSSGSVLSLHTLFGLDHDMTQTLAVFDNNQQILHQCSLIIRLCNDQVTFNVEIERGDAPTSLLCYMREANVKEEEARKHINHLIMNTWKKITGLFISSPHSEQPIIKYIVNVARVGNYIYGNEDGFGQQDQETKKQVLSCLIDPLPLP